MRRQRAGGCTGLHGRLSLLIRVAALGSRGPRESTFLLGSVRRSFSTVAVAVISRIIEASAVRVLIGKKTTRERNCDMETLDRVLASYTAQGDETAGKVLGAAFVVTDRNGK